jgi:hypothetical protein
MTYKSFLDKIIEDVDDIVKDIIEIKNNPEHEFPNCIVKWRMGGCSLAKIKVLKKLIDAKLWIDYRIYCEVTYNCKADDEGRYLRLTVKADWSNCDENLEAQKKEIDNTDTN